VLQATEKALAESTAEATARMNVAKALEDGSLDHQQFMKSYRASRMAEFKKQASLGNERWAGQWIVGGAIDSWRGSLGDFLGRFGGMSVGSGPVFPQGRGVLLCPRRRMGQNGLQEPIV